MVKVPPWFKSAVNKTRSLRRRAVLFSLILVAGRYKLITNLMQFAQLLFLPCVAILRQMNAVCLHESCICDWQGDDILLCVNFSRTILKRSLIFFPWSI